MSAAPTCISRANADWPQSEPPEIHRAGRIACRKPALDLSKMLLLPCRTGAIEKSRGDPGDFAEHLADETLATLSRSGAKGHRFEGGGIENIQYGSPPGRQGAAD